MLLKQKALDKRIRRNVPLGRGTDWSTRANPQEVIAAEGYGADNSALAIDSALNRLRTIARENATFMRHMLVNNKGVVEGFHGTTTANAVSISRDGFQNRTNDEGLTGVSAWAGVVGHEAVRFAAERSREAGASDEGAIIHVRMTDPIEDTAHGRLEWRGDANATEVINIYTVPEFREYLLRTGGVALSTIVEPPSLPYQADSPRIESI